MVIRAAGLILALLCGAIGCTPDRPLATLEAKYARAGDTYAEVAGLRLHVRDSGPVAAPAIVMLHGFGASLHTWEPWAEALSGRFRVIRYDLPGFGLTGPDPTGDYSDARAVAVLAALMDRLGVQRASLIGNSLGGEIAWRFAAAHPARVTRLVLIAPAGFAPPGRAYGEPMRVPLLAQLLRYTLPEAVVRSGVATAYGDPAALNEAVVMRYWELLLAPGVREAILARAEQSRLADPRPLLRQVGAPTLLLWGERDRLIPVASARDYLSCLPAATLVVLPGLGHVPQEEAPATALAPVRAFLGG